MPFMPSRLVSAPTRQRPSGPDRDNGLLHTFFLLSLSLIIIKHNKFSLARRQKIIIWNEEKYIFSIKVSATTHFLEHRCVTMSRFTIHFVVSTRLDFILVYSYKITNQNNTSLFFFFFFFFLSFERLSGLCWLVHCSIVWSYNGNSAHRSRCEGRIRRRKKKIFLLKKFFIIMKNKCSAKRENGTMAAAERTERFWA